MTKIFVPRPPYGVRPEHGAAGITGILPLLMMPGDGQSAPEREREPESDRRTLRDRAARAPGPADIAGYFPHLEVLELLGQGGMGYVYKARQRGLDRLVALKLLPADVSEDKSFADRFGREARALARLSHPSIVAVHDSGQVACAQDAGVRDEGSLYYFLMEFVDGLNLRELIHRSPEHRLDRAEALRIVAALCDALEYAHEEGVVHRDIKPENILLDRKGRVKIADFGLAKLLGRDDDVSSLGLTMPRQRLGTPHYMAPEQTERPLEVDHRADIYSVGVVLYEMLTGELPLGRFELPSQLGRGDLVLDEIVSRALEKNPQRRYQRASEIRTALSSAMSGQGLAAPAPATPGPAAPARATPAPAANREPAELASAVAVAAGDDLLASIDVRQAWRRVGPPATWLFVTGIVSLVLLSPTGVIMILAGMKMKRLEWRVFSIIASLVAILPLSTCFPLSIPVGVWTFYVLTRPEIAAAFDLAAAARMEQRSDERSGRDIGY